MLHNKCSKVIRIRISDNDLKLLTDYSKSNGISVSKACRLLIRSLINVKK